MFDNIEFTAANIKEKTKKKNDFNNINDVFDVVRGYVEAAANVGKYESDSIFIFNRDVREEIIRKLQSLGFEVLHINKVITVRW